MKLLALDLSTARGSLAWFDDIVIPRSGDPVQHAATHVSDWPNDRKNSALFFETLQRTIREFGLPEMIIVGLGPGSYAGVRISISAAVGLQATGATLIGYPSICAFDCNQEEYAVIGDARRQSFFFIHVTRRRLVGDFELLDAAALQDRIASLVPGISLFSPDALPQFQPSVQQTFPSAEILGQLATDADRVFVRPPLQPIYLREANVTVPKPLLRGIHR